VLFFAHVIDQQQSNVFVNSHFQSLQNQQKCKHSFSKQRSKPLYHFSLWFELHVRIKISFENRILRQIDCSFLSKVGKKWIAKVLLQRRQNGHLLFRAQRLGATKQMQNSVASFWMLLKPRFARSTNPQIHTVAPRKRVENVLFRFVKRQWNSVFQPSPAKFGCTVT
jgi:hypothetical protein